MLLIIIDIVHTRVVPLPNDFEKQSLMTQDVDHYGIS